jgi:hypothetical protein
MFGSLNGNSLVFVESMRLSEEVEKEVNRLISWEPGRSPWIHKSIEGKNNI